jgi:aspartate carbamoyltransferase regulatory subunit
MIVDSINNGIVIDHLTKGKGLEVLSLLKLGNVDYPVALIMNAHSNKYGKKDLVKIENMMDVDLTVLGLLDPRATVVYIRQGTVAEKKNLCLPEKVIGAIQCKNPRCITTVEKDIPQTFLLVDRKNRCYRCEYCDDLKILKGDGLDG